MKPSLYPIIGLIAFQGRFPIEVKIEKIKHTPYVEQVFKEQRKRELK